MAAHVRVYFRDSDRLVTGRVYPEEVSSGEAKRLTEEYLKAEGLDSLGQTDRFVQKADYTRYAHEAPVRYGITRAVPGLVHLPASEEGNASVCGQDLAFVFECLVKPPEVCRPCTRGIVTKERRKRGKGA